MMLDSAGTWQGLSGTRLRRKDSRSSVAVMDIAIHGHCALQPAFLVHPPDGHRHIMDHAEAFSMIGKSVVKTSGNVHAQSPAQGQISGQNGTSGGEPEGLDQFRRVRNLHLHFFQRRERAGLQLRTYLSVCTKRMSSSA